MWVTPVVIIAATGYLFVEALTVDPMGCTDPKRQYLPDLGLLTATAAAVLVGRQLGQMRYQSQWSGWQQHRRTQIWGAIGLCLLLLFAAVALVYEAIGVDLATNYGVPSLEPITYYIRCAIYNDKRGHGEVAIFTYGVLIVLGLIVGNYLWSAGKPASED
jgi:hypothetical protein